MMMLIRLVKGAPTCDAIEGIDRLKELGCGVFCRPRKIKIREAVRAQTQPLGDREDAIRAAQFTVLEMLRILLVDQALKLNPELLHGLGDAERACTLSNGLAIERETQHQQLRE